MSTIEELLATPQVKEVWEVDNRYVINSSYSDDQGPIEIVGKDIGDMSSQISIQGESISQYVEFIMPRYYDNIDLSEKNIVIHYTAGDRGGENAPINVYKSQERIKFGWAIPAGATANEGTLSIGIWARGYVGTEEYMWKSRIAYYKVERGPVLGEGLSEPDVQWYLDFVREMDVKVAEASLYSTRAKQSENVAVESKESAIASSQTASGSANTAVRKATEASNSASVASAHSATAKVSADNAKKSETKAQGYAEEARNNAEGFEPISDMMTGESPTATNSTNAPFIYGKFKGYTLQNGEPTPDNPVEINGLAKDGTIDVKTTRKNIFGGLALENKIVGVVSGATKNEETGSVQFSGSAIAGHILFDSFKANTQYTFIFYGKNLGSSKYLNMRVYYSDGTNKLMLFPETDYSNFVFTSEAGKTIKSLEGVYQDSVTILYPEKCGVFEGVITVDDFEPYTETVAEIDLTEPLYEGDYIEYRADGTGVLYRKMEKVVFDSEEDVRIMSFEANNYVAVTPKVKAKKNNINVYSNYYKTVDVYNLNNIPENGILVNHNGDIILKDERYTTLEEYKSWLQSNPVTVVYELETPQEIELTAEQLAQFKQLRTFEPITNVLCDGEVEMIYFRNNPNGRVAGMLQRQIDSIVSTLSSTEEVSDEYRNNLS